MAKKEKVKINRLGRGLGDLISKGVEKKPSEKTTLQKQQKSTSNEIPPSNEASNKFSEIDVSLISANPHQPRRDFPQEEIIELASSIMSEGLIQPIAVRKSQNGYELISGERRLRAFKHLSIQKIPAVLHQASDSSMAVSALIENLQRSDLNPIDEALALAKLIKNFKLTQEALSQRIAKKRASISNSIRLLSLDTQIQSFIAKSILSVGHAKVLLTLTSKDEQIILARNAIEKSWSVRQLEEAVKNLQNKNSSNSAKKKKAIEDSVIFGIKNEIASKFNTKIDIVHTPKKGKIVIEYYGNDDLQRILEQMGIDCV